MRDFHLGSESLATALQQVGSETQALHVLEEAAQVKAHYDTHPTHQGLLAGIFGRFHVQARLAHEYRQLGRIDEALAIEDTVLHMLKYADDDHPIVRQIRES